MEIEEIKRNLQTNQRSHLEEMEEEELERPGTTREGEEKPKAAFTTEEETEIHNQKDQTNKLKKNESTSYQVTQITNGNRPRLQKLRNMSKIKVIMKTANEAMEKLLDE